MTRDTAYLTVMISKASGEKMADIRRAGRRRPLPALRWMIGKELMARGYNISYAAHEVGLDRATLRYGLEQLEHMQHDEGWALEQRIAVEFHRLIDNEPV